MWESGPWKDQLLRICARLEARTRQRRWHQFSYASVELELMQAFYMVRKLIEAPGKLSETVKKRPISVTKSPLRDGAVVRSRNWHFIDLHYDMDAASSFDMSLLAVCNQFIHSFVFMTCHDENGGLQAIHVSSDHLKDKALITVSIDEILRCLAVVGHDYPANGSTTVDLVTGKETVIATQGVLDVLEFRPDEDLR